LGACTEGGNWSMVTEYMSNGDLHHLIHDSGKVIKVNKKIKFAIDICQGMAWLSGEEVKIIHRDLKPANVLIDSNWNCKIADFGLALLKSKGMLKGDDSGGGSPLWMSPEALLEEPVITVKTDVYSFGLVFWEMMTQKDLFPEYNDLDLFTTDIAIKGKRPSLEGVEPIISEIITRCWAKDVKVRPTFKELIPILQNARVDINLPVTLCPTANQMWKEKFLSSSKVAMSVFMKQLFVTLGKPENPLHKNMIAQLLWGDFANLDNKMMSTGKLSRLIKWFGPLKQGEVNMLMRMEEVMKQKWFFGTVNVDQSEKFLRNMPKEESCFIVRLNTGGSTPIEQSPITISRRIYDEAEKSDTCYHTRVYPSKVGGFYIKIEGQTIKQAGQIGDFILYIERNHRNICGNVAKGHPFESLFASKPVRRGAYDVHAHDSEEED